MRFRTEIEPRRSPIDIAHDTPVLMLGSCFTDEIGQKLDDDGFCTMHNPLGPLYNPCSLLRCLQLSQTGVSSDDFVAGPRGYHCLDFASRYSGNDADALTDEINRTLEQIRLFIAKHPVAIITLGSAFIFRHLATGNIVGNCHKFPASDFHRHLLPVPEASAVVGNIAKLLLDRGCRAVIFTVSPIRHLADGLHGNTLSKATLHLAIESAIETAVDTRIEYFPSYEAVIDDLRDYRFYATDMKHPSEAAVDYIYELFANTYFSKATIASAAEARRRTLAGNHRQIL